MSIDLYRVDERLIHGQVVIGWGNQLWPGRYIVVDEELAESDWEQELYTIGAGGAEVVFVAPDAAREELAAWKADEVRTILLTRDIPTMRGLAEGGLLEGAEINLGGIHHGPGRVEVLTYLHLSEEDRADLRALEQSGSKVSARDLPDAHRVSLSTLLGG